MRKQFQGQLVGDPKPMASLAIDATDKASARSAPRYFLAFRRIWANDPIEAALFFAFILALAWIPFWFGSDQLLAWGVNAILFPFLALAFELAVLLRSRPHPFALRRLAVSAALFALVLLWIVVQMSPLTPVSWRHPVWAMAADVLGQALPGAISVNPDLTARALLRLLTAASALWLSIQLCRNSERAYFLLHAIFGIVAAYAAYGLIADAFFRGDILWFAAQGSDPAPHVRSTFLDRNAFATYAGLGLVVGVGLILRLYRREASAGVDSRWRRLASSIETTSYSGWRLLPLALITLVALLGTLSRGGIIATALGLFALFALAVWRRGSLSATRLEAVTLLAVVTIAFGEFFFAPLTAVSLEEAVRPAVYSLVAKSILDSPVLGFGYGCFSDVFQLYRDQSIDATGVWNRAHNVYLEVLQGLGLVFGSFLLLALAWLAHLCVRGALTRRRDATPAAIAAAAAVLVGFHASVDYGPQIQAVTLTFMALLGAGVAQSVSSSELVSD